MRRRIAGALLCCCIALAIGVAARAQTLPRITVTSFTLSADTNAPQLEQPFHLIVTVHVRERVSGFDTLDLPILAELELLGDERHVVSDSHGTTYRETIDVVVHHHGDVRIAPATLAAIDARDGRGKRYFSNELLLHVGGGTFVPNNGVFDDVAAVGRKTLLVLAGVVCTIVLVSLLRRRRKPQAPALAPMPPPPPPRARDPREDLRDAYLTLSRSRTRGTAVQVRTFVRRMVGANDVETLSDVLTRPSARDPGMRVLLQALERAAFTHDGDLSAAIDDALSALERVSA